MVCKLGDMLNSEGGMTAVGLVLLEKVVAPDDVVANKELFVASDASFSPSFAASPGCIVGFPARKPPTSNNPQTLAITTPESAGCRSITAHKRCSHGDWVMASSKVSNRAVSPARNRAVT